MTFREELDRKIARLEECLAVYREVREMLDGCPGEAMAEIPEKAPGRPQESSAPKNDRSPALASSDAAGANGGVPEPDRYLNEILGPPINPKGHSRAGPRAVDYDALRRKMLGLFRTEGPLAVSRVQVLTGVSWYVAKTALDHPWFEQDGQKWRLTSRGEAEVERASCREE